MFKLETREIFIYDDIGPSWAGMVSADGMREALSSLGDGDVNVRINSYGGSVDEALGMIELLSRHNGTIKVTVDSIAASAASFFPAVFESSAAKHSRLMIHDPWGFAMGNANEMRKIAEILDKYRDSTAGLYASAMGKSMDEVRQLMADETWYSADEAFEAGLVDSVTDTGSKVQPKSLKADRFKNAPKDLIGDTAKKPVDQSIMVAATLAVLKRKIQSRKR